MVNEITCIVCGGTSFHKDAGFYYCNECQTQSQDVQERVFDRGEHEADEHPSSRPKTGKRIRSDRTQTVDRLTTWECYNYILRGLVDELIQLGADVKLKKTVHILWFQYLNTLEVTENVKNDLPKVSAIYSKLDVEVIYGKPSKRRRKSASRTSSPLDSSLHDSSQKAHSKHRRSFVLAEYSELSTTLQSEDVLSQSLTSLRSVSEASSDSIPCIQYNKFARKELSKTMKNGHLKRHMRDIHNEITCHKPKYRAFPTGYVQSPAILSRIKIYGLLYLALLINRDNIQLADLLRYIREGHLSYHSIDHFYPDNLDKAQLNLKTWNESHIPMSHYRLRVVAAQLAHFLNVTTSVPMQNLPQLCRRYCLELNLPDEIWGYCVNLLSIIKPKMVFMKTSTIIPNYEARAMSIIIFFLKLMFGLDDKTEHLFSKRAAAIATSTSEPMFVWDDWIFHIQYRKLLLTQHHFPTQCLYDDKNVDNTDLFLNFINGQDLKFESETKLSRESEVIEQLLSKLKDKFYEVPQALTFNVSLTPFRSYTEMLAESDVAHIRSYLTDVLKLNFTDCSIRFLVNPFEYLKILHPGCRIGLKHRGVSNDIEVISYKTLKTERELWRKRAKRDVFVRFSDSKSTHSCHDDTSKFTLQDTVSVKNTKSILKMFENHEMGSYKVHMKNLFKLGKKMNVSMSTTSQDSRTSSPNLSRAVHYNPYERYLLKNLSVDIISNDEFNDFIKTFSRSFQTLLNECARVTEQEVKEMFIEFNNVEIYLCYVANWTQASANRDKVFNPNLQNLIARATKNW